MQTLRWMGMNGSPLSVKRIKKPNGKGKKEKKKAKLVGNESSPTLNIKNVDELNKTGTICPSKHRKANNKISLRFVSR
jgi:hypothetical protein